MRAALGVRPCAALRGLFFFAPLRVGPAVGGATSPQPISRCAARILGAGRAIETMWMVAPCLGKRSAGLFNKTPGVPPRRRAAAQDVLKMSWKVVAGLGESRPKRTGPRLGAGKRAAPSGRAGRKRKKGKGKRKGRERKREKRVEKESMRDVLTSKKSHLKSWRRCLFGCRVAPARRRAIRTFNGRLSAFLLIFQRRREALRQERASALFSDFTKEVSGQERAGQERTPQNVDKNKGEKKKGPDAAPPGVRSGPPSRLAPTGCHSLTPSAAAAKSRSCAKRLLKAPASSWLTPASISVLVCSARKTTCAA